jgi:hypothetical protein
MPNILSSATTVVSNREELARALKCEILFQVKKNSISTKDSLDNVPFLRKKNQKSNEFL